MVPSLYSWGFPADCVIWGSQIAAGSVGYPQQKENLFFLTVYNRAELPNPPRSLVLPAPEDGRVLPGSPGVSLPSFPGDTAELWHLQLPAETNQGWAKTPGQPRNQSWGITLEWAFYCDFIDGFQPLGPDTPRWAFRGRMELFEEEPSPACSLSTHRETST